MRKKIAKLYNNKFVQGGILLTIVTFVTNLLSYLFYSLSAKAVGPVGYGEIITLISYLSILGIPMTIITTIIIRRLGFAGEHRDAVAVGFANWFVLKIKKWWFLIPLYFALVFVIPKFTNLYFSSSLTLLLMLFFGMIGTVYGAILQGAHLFVIFSLTAVITAVIKIAGVLLSLYGYGELEMIYAGLVFGLILGIIPAIIKINSLKSTISKTSYALNKKITTLVFTKSNLITLLSLVGISTLGNADIILAKKIFSSHDAGIYGAWSLFAKTVLYILGPVNALLLIFFSAKETTKDQKKIMGFLLISLLFFGIIMFVGYSTVSHLLVSVILSRRFVEIEPLMGQAAIFGITYATVTIINNYFIAKKSNLSLISIFALPFYVVALSTWGNNITSFININIIFTTSLTLIYFVAFCLPSKK